MKAAGPTVADVARSTVHSRLTLYSHSIRIPAIVEAVPRGRRVAAVSQGMVESLHHGEMSELASVLLQVAHDEAEAAIVEW